MKPNPLLLGCAMAVSMSIAAPAADSPAASAQKEKSVKPAHDVIQVTDVKPIAMEGEHNGFPVMTRWKDQIYLMYRRAVGHTGTGDLVLLRSTDGEKWTEVRKFDFGPDDRNGQLLAT